MMNPKFARVMNGELRLGDSIEAKRWISSSDRISGFSKLPSDVRKEAMEKVRQAGADTSNHLNVLGQYTIQFGGWRGQTFKWILENCLGYAAWFINSLGEERMTKGVPISENKHAFKEYVLSFAEGREAVEMKKKKKQVAQVVEKKDSTPVVPKQSLASSLHHLLPAGEARKLYRDMSQKARPIVRPNIPDRTKVRTAASCLSDDELCAEVEDLEKSLETSLSTNNEGVYSKVTSSSVVPKTSKQAVKPVSGSPRKATPKKSSGPVAATLATSSFVLAPPAAPTRTRARVSSVVISEPSISATVTITGTSLENTTVTTSSSTSINSNAPSISSGSSAPSRTPHETSITSVLQSPGQEYPILDSWKSTLPAIDHQWISKAIFTLSARGKPELDLRKVDRLWWYPPQPQLHPTHCPRTDRYFGHRLLLWMPRKLWRVRLYCPNCQSHELTSSGLYRNTRLVLDIDGFYNLATEYLHCGRCMKNQIGWSRAILNQLDVGHRSQFPVILTYKSACDVRVIRLLRQRGLGNSSTQLQKKIVEQHNEAWLSLTLQYLTDSQSFLKASKSQLVKSKPVSDIPKQIPVPTYQWLLAVYCQDVLQRLEEVKASITSIFGRVLKMDSTKKVVKKLAGDAAGTAAWSTNISNEVGQVLMSVLTAGEGYGLENMVQGIIKRYADAEVPPPNLLYVDSQCCGSSPVTTVFTEAWPNLVVRLDIWHLMRRFAVAVTTDTHRLYGTFMGQLSYCIFQWDQADFALLKKAKRNEMTMAHILEPSEEDVIRRISRKEMTLHCRRSTRGEEETTRMLQQLLEMFDSDRGKDTMGVPLLNHDRIWETWKSQKCHLRCIQDPVGVPLYMKTGTLKKGGIELPVYRCARGSTSIESFHLHLQRFIPGTSANATNFQAYLVEGLMRWNQDRAAAAIDSHQDSICYNSKTREAANRLGENVLGRKIFHNFQAPKKYTGEKIGVEYLFGQTGQILKPIPEDAEEMESSEEEVMKEEDLDEGFEELELDDPTVAVVDKFLPLQDLPRKTPSPKPILQIPTDEAYRQMLDNRPSAAFVTAPSYNEDQQQPGRSTENVSQLPPVKIASVGPNNIEGFDKVDDLAEYLVSLKDSQRKVLNNQQADTIISLWDNLHPYDRSPTKFSARHQTELIKGRFKSPKSRRLQTTTGVDSVKRCFLGPNAGPAQWPDSNRYMEAVISKLCLMYPGELCEGGKRVARWSLILRAYRLIKDMVHSCQKVMDKTNIQLADINQKTISQWYNAKDKKREKDVLEQGLTLIRPSAAPEPLPLPLHKPQTLTSGNLSPIRFEMPQNTVGQGTKVRRRILVDEIKEQPVSQIPIQPKKLITLGPPTHKSDTSVNVPYSTQNYRKRCLKMEETGEFKRKYIKKTDVKLCRHCGEDCKSGGHKQYFGNIYCPQKMEIAFEDWRNALAEEKGYGKKKKI